MSNLQENELFLHLLNERGILAFAPTAGSDQRKRPLSRRKRQLVNLVDLPGLPEEREAAIDLLCARIRASAGEKAHPIEAVACTPHVSSWIGHLVASRLRASIIEPVWPLLLEHKRQSTEDGEYAATLTGSVPMYAHTWIVDGDPDTERGMRVLRCADAIQSTAIGCHVLGIACFFERTGETRERVSKALPNASFVSLYNVADVLQEFADGKDPALVDPALARRHLQQLRHAQAS